MSRKARSTAVIEGQGESGENVEGWRHFPLSTLLESSIAYQSAQGLPIEWILEINRYAMKPSLNIILDMEPEKSLQRKPRLTEKFEEAAFLRKVRAILLARAKSESYPIVDTSGPINETQARINDIVKKFMERYK